MGNDPPPNHGGVKLEDLAPKAVVGGLDDGGPAVVVSAEWHGDSALTLTYRRASGGVAEELLTRRDEKRLRIVEQGRPWSFDGDGALFRLASEARRIQLAHLFDPLLAVHTSEIEPYPHQLTAVYESMLPRQPLRFLLADDPGAGKTIMAGLLIKELIARGDLERCLIVCPAGLAVQWQEELDRRFGLGFRILTNEGIENAAGGNWFVETDLAIARLDKLARNDGLKAMLEAPECSYDLVVCDEAHKMSATFTGGEVKFTKRYRLGQLLSGITRHFLLMTATPHNGKEEDFQLFLALLDGDRFEGRFTDGVHLTDAADLMRRTVKEKLLKFDGRPLFPERVAHTAPYRLSPAEKRLYDEVTTYVQEELGRAEALLNGKRARAVGFALTLLQRRLASSTAAVHESLRRRRERLEARLKELKAGGRRGVPELDEEEIEDLADLPEEEAEQAEGALDAATAAGTIAELEAEIRSLARLSRLAAGLRKSGEDTKWRELSDLLASLFTPAGLAGEAHEKTAPYGPIPPPGASPRHKLVVFTEHLDTLHDLEQRIGTRLGRPEALVVIHGRLDRRKRRAAEEAFRHDPRARVLLATDAAGEGINLHCAHLMVNYDLPWNPNRLEQRFGRIHRIGQTEVCHLWNLLAAGTREGDVYRTLLDKLEQARRSLGGQVFDVLGKLQFGDRPLRYLLIEAIRYGERPEVRERLFRVVAEALDRPRLEKLLAEEALIQEVVDAAGVARVREAMERAAALSTKKGKEAHVEPVVEGKGYRFEVRVGAPPDPAAARRGTKLGRGANFRCLVSGSPMTGDHIKAEGKAGRMGARLMAVVAEGHRGRVYLSPTQEHEEAARGAAPAWRPEGDVPARLTGGTCVPYGLTQWGDLFTARQLVALTTFSDLVAEARERVRRDATAAGLTDDGVPLREGGAGAPAYAEAVSLYLAFVVDRCADFSNSGTRWVPGNQKVMNLYGKQAIAMTWDFPEAAVLENTVGGFLPASAFIADCLGKLPTGTVHSGEAEQRDAASRPVGRGAMVSTDPPYYDNVAYADLSDFFHLWLRRSLRTVFPDLLATLATPKGDELVASPYRQGGRQEAEAFFLAGMRQAVRRLAEQTHPAIPVTIYYAFKQAETKGDAGTVSTGWETFLDAVIQSGFLVTGTWPMRTEQAYRSVGLGANALASSIVLVCRKRAADAALATRREFADALRTKLPSALAQLQRGNIAPVDLAQAAIGPGMAVFTGYSKVLDASGEAVSVRHALALINQVLDETLAEQEGDFDPDTRWALAWFEQHGFEEGDFGAAETLSKAKNTSVGGLVGAGMLASEGGRVRLLRAAELPADWDPVADRRLTVWEMVHHLVRALEADGEKGGALLLRRLGGVGETARELVYRLYGMAERRKRPTEARSYDGLVRSWPEMARLARDPALGTEQPRLLR